MSPEPDCARKALLTPTFRRMKLRPALGALALVVLVVTSCSTVATGRATLSADRADTGSGRTIGVPSVSTPRTVASTGEQPTAAQTTTVAATTVTTPSTTRRTVTSADTTTEFTTIFETTDPAPIDPAPTDPAPTGPASVIGPIDMGANSSGYVAFQSPSGNIMCAIFDGGDFAEARCDIRSWNYPAPPATQDCGPADFSAGTAEIGAEGSGVVGACAGDTVADPNNPVLAYGHNAGIGQFGCHSAENGVTCANLRTQRGFRLSRDSYQVF